MFEIAVVDDDDDSRKMMCDFLDFHGFSYRDYASPMDFLRYCRDRVLPKLVVSDINMPQMDGLTMSEKLKSEFPELPIILVTAMPSERDRMRAGEIGVSHYMGKPFGLSQFYDIINQTLCDGPAA